MAMANALLSGGLTIDDIEWQSNLNQLGRHHASSGEVARFQ
jgi:hypothetical protein